jgi:hypothetical protein
MTLDAAYLRAAVPEPVQVLGLRLKPFSLGHYLLLARFNCAYVTGATPTLGDLVLGALVCSQTYADALDFLSGDWQQDVQKWDVKLTRQNVDWKSRVTLLADYIRAGMVTPAYSATEGGSSPSGAPWTELLRVGLLEMGLTEEEVLNRPLALSWWSYLTWREVN